MPLTLNVKNVLQRNILPKDCSKPKRHMTSYLVTIATDYHETSSKGFKKKITASREVSKGKTFCFKKARKLRKLVGEATAVVPFLNARCNFCRQWENVWPVIGVFLLNRKKTATQGQIRSSRSNRDLSYRKLSPLPLHYHTDQPKIPKKFST